MTLRFTLSLDVTDALYTAIGTADLTGLGDAGTSNYTVQEAHVTQGPGTTWEFDVELEHTSGPEVTEDELADALIEYFDAELVVDIEDMERR